VGEHAGVHHYTVGQRRGLGVAAGEPLYVLSTDATRQLVVVGASDGLLRTRFKAGNVNWISIAPPREPVRAEVKIRNKHAAATAMLYPSDGGVEVVFEEPQRAITPGQGAVFYADDLVLGGGWIV
jgi:tRNA-specific 2-thiouridylase